ncbi:SDR family NAD(P)-dependent oxidoreductase [Fontimonas sp. SYSU GA230001]|uniref:SDR family NAD(P)-dependent oxidoreductase n=1 Tax=Fontimonas sp. SYSU GA230001 TaxID=3142450 RepID=UPI0032B3C9F2
MIREFRQKLCVVTGGSSGIGLAVASALASEGARLLLVARDPAALDRAAQELRGRGASEVRVLSADVARDDEIARLPAAIATMGPCADLVVNCAGIVSGGLLADVPMAEWRRLHEVNVMGVLRVLHAVLPGMLARAARGDGGAHIVNIASGAGLVGFPGLSAYGATKAAVVSLGESLRGELADAGIGVTTVCPGFVKTPIATKFTLFGRMDNARTQQRVLDWFERNDLEAATVARRTLDAVRRDRALVVIGRDVVSGYWTKRIAPRVLERVLRRMAPRAPRRDAA